MSRLFIVELVPKPEPPELIPNDALKGWTQEGSGNRFLQDAANEQVDPVQGSVELLETRYQLQERLGVQLRKRSSAL